ncbi:MAG: DEAD/DEAH box helicase family protein [Lachnospiraceae bacterium]|nr:DEAD/DEAH box helicase family protein [Lachnospiraceae bacterium]
MTYADECHHAGSATAVEVLQKINARYVYGVTATPKRSDSMEKIIYMLPGPIRHGHTAKERALEQRIGHYVYPR